jgi:hypothetical protein
MPKEIDRIESHTLAAALYTLLSGLQMLMSPEATGEPTRADVRGAVLGSFEDFSRLRTAFAPEAALQTRSAGGAVSSYPVSAIIDMVLSIRPRFEAWDGTWPVPEDCGRAASRLLELTGWPT